MSNRIDLKVVLLGKENVGKTSLFQRFIKGTFFEGSQQATVGASYGAKHVVLDGRRVVVMGLWDTAGSERYEAMTKMYYRSASAAIICYDISSLASFEKARFWVSELLRNEENCRIFLCGTKLDLAGEDFYDTTRFRAIRRDITRRESSRQVKKRTAEGLAEEVGAVGVWEVSSKEGWGVHDLLHEVVMDWIAQGEKRKLSLDENIRLQTKGSRYMCC